MQAEIAKELISLRTENGKVFDLGNGKRRLEVHVGAIHYKDDYSNLAESWKDINLTWVGNKITTAPYELTLDGLKLTLKDKKTGEVSIIELLEIEGQPVPMPAWLFSKGLARYPNIVPDLDLEIRAENSSVTFARVPKSVSAPKKAKFRVNGVERVFTLKKGEEA